MDTQKVFLEELNIFRNEVQSALRFLYTELTIHAKTAKNKRVLSALNSSPTFWNTILNALQHSTFITLGRIFDTKPNMHSIHTLFGIAQKNKNLFSKESFTDRWQSNEDKRTVDHYLQEYLKKVYVPNDEDFKKLKKFIAQQKRTYLDIYGPIRHHFGHKIYAKNEDVKVLFDKVKVRDLEKFCVRLENIHEAFWQLYHNGIGPMLPFKRQSYSTHNILRKKYEPLHSKPFNAQIIEDVNRALDLLKLGMVTKIKAKLSIKVN